MSDLSYSQPFTVRQSVGYLIRRAQQLMLPRAEAVFADTELTLSQWIALKLVNDGISQTCAHIARQLGHNTGATTRLIDQLEERGLIRRHRVSPDRRLVNLQITEAGIAAVAEMHPRMVVLWNELLEGFTREEVATLVGLLTRLVDRLEEDGEECS